MGDAMRVAIVCPGPSLALFAREPAGTFDRVVGVNRAATQIPCDLWAAGDYPLIQAARGQVRGTPTLLTADASAAWLRDHGCPWPHPVLSFEAFYDGSEETYLWPMFTFTAALHVAWKQGASSIDVFGCDWAGTGDFDGTPGGNRSEDRWALERRIFANVCHRMGIPVKRHTASTV